MWISQHGCENYVSHNTVVMCVYNTTLLWQLCISRHCCDSPLLPIYLYHWHHVFTDVEWKWWHFLQTDTTTFQANNPQCSVWRTNWSHKMLLAQLPLSAQSHSSSPFLDLSLFSYDYKCESVMERHKSCGEHRIRYTETTMNGSFKSNKYILKALFTVVCMCVLQGMMWVCWIYRFTIAKLIIFQIPHIYLNLLKSALL